MRSIVLSAPAAVLEIGGAWPVRQGLRAHRGPVRAGVAVIAHAPRPG